MMSRHPDNWAMKSCFTMDSGLVLYVNLSYFLHMNDPMDITCMPNFRNGLIGVGGGAKR